MILIVQCSKPCHLPVIRFTEVRPERRAEVTSRHGGSNEKGGPFPDRPFLNSIGETA